MQYCKGDLPFFFILSTLSSLLQPCLHFFPPLLLSLSQAFSFLTTKTLFFLSSLPKSNTPTIPPLPRPLSLFRHPFLFLSGHSGDRHCSGVVLLCLSAGESGPAFTLSSIAAWVSSKAAIQPAQSLPTGNRPTKEKGAARLLCSAPSEAACLHHLI